MLRPSMIIMLCCLFCCTAIGKNIDSLLTSKISDSDKVMALSNYAFSIAERNPDSALLLGRKSLAVALAAKDNPGKGHPFNAIGWAYFRSGKYDSAKWYLSAAVAIFHAQHNAYSEGKVLINLGNVSQTQQDYEAALTELSAATRLLGSSDGVDNALAEKMIGIIYRKKADVIKAKEYLKRSSDDFLKLGEQKYYADAIGSLGNVYYDLGDMDSATYCYHKALKIDLGQKNLSGAALVYEGLGAAFLFKSDSIPVPWLDSALYNYQCAYNLFCALKDTQDMVYEKFTLGMVLIKKKEYPLAQKYLEEALVTFQSEHSITNIYNVIIALSRLHSAMHDYHGAYDFLMKADLYYDTLNQQEKNATIADMLARYEADKKDRTIALLNTQNALLNTKKQLAERNLYKTRITELFTLVLIAFSVFLALVLLNRYKIKQRLKELQMRNRISNDLHDDVGSSLSSILLLSNIAAGSAVHKPELVSKISENAREAIERISDIIWTTNPKYDDGENLRPKIINYIAPLCQMQGIAFRINIAEPIKSVKFSMEMRKNIFLIIKEALNNILKHSGATEVVFELFLKERKLVFEICDNGKGFDNNNSNTGNGLKTMRERAQALGGELSFDTSPDGGTKISVTMPLTRASYFVLSK